MRPTGLWLLATIAILVTTAIVGLGRLHGFDHADVIVPVLCSLDHWTLYYWEQDRIGMLLPLIAMPVKRPLYNLLFQCSLNTLAGWSVFFLVPRAVVRGTRASLAIGSVSLLGWILFIPAAPLWDYLFTQPYGLSLSLAATGMILLEPETQLRPWRIATAAAALLLACWSNLAVAVPLAPLLLHRTVPLGTLLRGAAQRSTRILLVASSVAFAIGLLISKLYTSVFFTSFAPTALGPLPLREWPRAQARLFATVIESMPGWFLVCWSVLLAVGLFGLAWLSIDSDQKRTSLRAVAALLLSALLSFLVAATSRHVGRNDFALRYAMPALLLFALSGVTAVVRSWGTRAPVVLWSMSLALLLIAAPIGGWLRFGPPSVELVRSDLQRRFGAEVAEIETSGADFLLGSYWKVWPAVFLIQEGRFLSGIHRPFWGLAPRALVTESDWRPLLRSGRRVAAFADESNVAAKIGRQLRLPPLSQVQQRGSLLIYEVTTEAGIPPPVGEAGGEASP